jgi:Uncharacterized protein conserved in bacteria
MPRVVDHRARRAEIVSAVIDLIAAEGAEAVTVRKAAAAAGVSAGALAHYFADKEALLTAAFAEVVARSGVRMRTLPTDGDVADLLYQALLAPLPLTDARRTEARVWLAFLDRALIREDATALLREVYEAWRRSVADIIGKGQRDGRLRADLDPDATAHALVALVDGLTLQAAVDPAALDADALRRLVDAQVRSLLAE